MLRARSTRRGARGDRGFTLLELLITLGVTTVALIGLLSLHVGIVRSNEGASRVLEATQVGQTTLESLRATRTINDMVDLLTGNANATAPIDVAFCSRTNGVVSATVTGRKNVVFRCRVVVTRMAAAADLWRIRVEIGWTEDGAVAGAQAGRLDRLVAVELLRSTKEVM